MAERSGGTSANDWQFKFAALQRIAAANGAPSGRTPSIAYYLEENHKANAKAIHETLQANLDIGKPFHGNTITIFIDDAIKRLPFSGTSTEFLDLAFDKWLLRLTDENVRAIASQGMTYHQFPQVRFYPSDVVGSPVENWEQQGAVDQRFMYDTRHAAAAWEKSRNHRVARHGRHPYTLCRETLPSVLKAVHDDCAEVEEVILLGAGSPDKDWLILDYLLTKTDRNVRLLICDGSFYMLAETFAALSDLLDDAGAASRVQIELFCFDFCNAAAWQVCNLRKSAKRLIFCMGGTIGNIREDQFMTSMEGLLDERTTLMIGSSFYESLDELQNNGEKDTASQYGSAAKELVISSVSDLIHDNYRNLTREDLVKNCVTQEFQPAEFGKNIPSIMASRVPGTYGAVFSLSFADSSRIRLSKKATVRTLYLAISRRYVKSEFKAFIERTLNAESSYVDHPRGDRFSYLIVRRKK